MIGRIVQLIKELTQASEEPACAIKGIGIGVAGTPDIDTGVIQLLPNLPGGWANVPLRSIVEQQVQLPVALINDVRAMTLGEWTFGAGRGADSLVCLGIGTGIGGGVVVNGQFHELYASGPAIAAMGVKEVMHGHLAELGIHGGLVGAALWAKHRCDGG